MPAWLAESARAREAQANMDDNMRRLAKSNAERAQADHQADADPGVRLDHGDELQFFHLGFLC